MLGSRDSGDACGAPTGPLGASETAAEATGDGKGGSPLPTDTIPTASPTTPWPHFWLQVENVDVKKECHESLKSLCNSAR